MSAPGNGTGARPGLVVDAVQYLVEPRDTWAGMAGAMAPRIVAVPDGGEGWAFDDGAWIRPFGLEVEAGRPADEVRNHGYRYDELPAGAVSASARLAAMTADGVDVAVLHPTFAIELAFAADPQVQIAAMGAYNDMAWQWAQDGDPDRLVPLALVPAVGVEAATAELARVAGLGFKGIVFTGWPSGARDPSPEDDRFWAACAEAGIVVSLLGGGPAGNRTPAAPRRYVGEGATRVRIVDLPQEMRWTQQAATNNVDLTWLVLTGVLDRFPALTLVLADAGAGWLPTCGELLDWNYRYAQFVAFAKLRLRPSDYIRRQVRVTLRDEPSAVESRGDIGVRSMLWSTGFPTSTSTWPESARSRAELLAGVGADDVAAIVGGNAADLYGLHRGAAVSV